MFSGCSGNDGSNNPIGNNDPDSPFIELIIYSLRYASYQINIQTTNRSSRYLPANPSVKEG